MEKKIKNKIKLYFYVGLINRLHCSQPTMVCPWPVPTLVPSGSKMWPAGNGQLIHCIHVWLSYILWVSTSQDTYQTTLLHVWGIPDGLSCRHECTEGGIEMIAAGCVRAENSHHTLHLDLMSLSRHFFFINWHIIHMVDEVISDHTCFPQMQ